mgnify:CR=1 FL=1
MLQADIQTDGQTDRQTDEVHSYNPLQLYSERIVNFTKQRSSRGSTWFNWIPKQDVLWVERCAVLMTINQP